MSDSDDISGLEHALTERAQKLAEVELDSGKRTRERILADTQQRLQLEKEREVHAAREKAERAYQQQVQAAELGLRAELDRLRQSLVDNALTKLPDSLRALSEDESRYLPLLQQFLREAAQAIERDELVAQFNARDLLRMQSQWDQIAQQAAPGKQLHLSPDTLDSMGGVLVTSADRAIRFDNTFEGRLERLDETLQGSMAERLMADIREN